MKIKFTFSFFLSHLIANATPPSSFSSTSISSSDRTSLPGSEKSESDVNPCDLKFSFRENTLPIGIAFVTGFLAALVIVGIAKLVIRCRSKSKKQHPTGDCLTIPLGSKMMGGRDTRIVEMEDLRVPILANRAANYGA